MNFKLKPRQARWLALSLLLLPLALFSSALWGLQKRYQDTQTRINLLQQQLEHDKHLAGQRAELERVWTTLQKRHSINSNTPRGQYLNSATAALAGAELQAYVTSMIAASGSHLQSIQPVTHLAGDAVPWFSMLLKGAQATNSSAKVPLAVVDVEVQLRADLKQLQQLIYSLETGKPGLLVRTVRITTAPVLRQADAQQVESATLDIYLVLSGFLRGANT